LSPRSPLVDTFLGTPFGSSDCHSQQKGVHRKVSTSGLRGDIVRFAQQTSATRCPLDPLLLRRTASLRIYQWLCYVSI